MDGERGLSSHPSIPSATACIAPGSWEEGGACIKELQNRNTMKIVPAHHRAETSPITSGGLSFFFFFFFFFPAGIFS